MKPVRYAIAMLISVLLLTGVLDSCNKEYGYVPEEEALVQFSADTVSFDTVFTTIGTVTKIFKIYNPKDDILQIKSITLQQGFTSRFRLNVDGDTSMVVRNLELGPKDSLFVFVQANINPNALTEPFLVEDAVVVDLGIRQQKVILNAYGRNAVYHIPPQGQIYSVIDCEGWDHTRPHVVVGAAVVDSAFTLSLTAGDEIYFADDGILWVYREGTLKINGTKENPVKFTSLRHDGWYDTLPGQWGYVWLSDGSINNEIDYAVIENGYVGLLLDKDVHLKISNTIVRNMGQAGILSNGGRIEGDNVLVHTCKTATLALQHGGNYMFRNSTFANFWKYDARQAPSIVLNNFWTEDNINYAAPLERADFYNCIIYGNYGVENGGEVLVYCNDAADHNVKMNHCLVKLGEGATIDTSNMIVNQDPLFRNNICDYHLREDSPAIGAGNQNWIVLPCDLDGRTRNNPPSIGAYEYYEE